MSFPPDPDSLVEELELVHLQWYFLVNALKATQQIEFYGLNVRRNYSGVPRWFSGNQLLPSMTNNTETDLREKASLKQRQKSLRIMTPMAKNKKIDSNTEIENTTANLRESINTYKSHNESDFHRYQ